jgi:hypothetical protein
MQKASGAPKKIEQLLDEIDSLLKKPDVGATLTERGINTSLALCIASGLRAYLEGKKAQAAEDLGTAAEEIAARLAPEAADGPARS